MHKPLSYKAFNAEDIEGYIPRWTDAVGQGGENSVPEQARRAADRFLIGPLGAEPFT